MSLVQEMKAAQKVLVTVAPRNNQHVRANPTSKIRLLGSSCASLECNEAFNRCFETSNLFADKGPVGSPCLLKVMSPESLAFTLKSNCYPALRSQAPKGCSAFLRPPYCALPNCSFRAAKKAATVPGLPRSKMSQCFASGICIGPEPRRASTAQRSCRGKNVVTPAGSVC